MTRPGPILLAIIFTATAVVLTVPLLIYEQPAPAGQKAPAPAATPAPPTSPPPTAPPPAAKAQVFAGKVVTLDVPAGQTGERRLALRGDDGATHTLVADDVSRMFRRFPQLRDVPVKITGRLLPGTKDLKVEFVQAIKNGKPFVVDFWCEVCQISHQQPGPCVCCGDELELRERPAP